MGAHAEKAVARKFHIVWNFQRDAPGGAADIELKADKKSKKIEGA